MSRLRSAAACVLAGLALQAGADRADQIAHHRCVKPCAYLKRAARRINRRTDAHARAFGEEQRGFRIVIFPGGTARAVAHTLQGYYASLHTHQTTAPFKDRMMDFDGLNALIGTPELMAHTVAMAPPGTAVVLFTSGSESLPKAVPQPASLALVDLAEPGRRLRPANRQDCA